jgi:NADH-quinone oxidoreductase subunit M
MTTSAPLLSLAIWLPILGALGILAIGPKQRTLALSLGLVVALAGFLVTLPLLVHFDRSTAAFQFVEIAAWIPRFNIEYALGVDGISVIFLALNSFITVLVVLAAWGSVSERLSQYLGAFLMLSGIMNGIFSALDAVLFYVFFEASLIPMYIIIGIWGGPRRVYAAFKFFLYTLMGSLLFLLCLVWLFWEAQGSFAITDWHQLPLTLEAQKLLFLAFLAAFAVKVPMWPVHTWLPDAHVEAPTGGSVVLAAIMLKLGAYGFLRFSLPILPDASHYFAPLMIGLSLVAVIYIGFVALVQTDMKKLIAYSSISHMGFVTLGFFIFNSLGIEGAIVQMISHGFVSGAMFLCVGVLYDRIHSRQIQDYGGIVHRMPVFTGLLVFFAMANCGLPATSGFVGEFMVILGALKAHFWVGTAAATTLILGAAYTLWMVKRVAYGPVIHPKIAQLTDISGREFLILASLAIAVLAMGVYPFPFTDIMHASVDHLIEQVMTTKLLAS